MLEDLRKVGGGDEGLIESSLEQELMRCCQLVNTNDLHIHRREHRRTLSSNMAGDESKYPEVLFDEESKFNGAGAEARFEPIMPAADEVVCIWGWCKSK